MLGFLTWGHLKYLLYIFLWSFMFYTIASVGMAFCCRIGFFNLLPVIYGAFGHDEMLRRHALLGCCITRISGLFPCCRPITRGISNTLCVQGLYGNAVVYYAQQI